mmetsp:Transcript_1686/g.2114  ORF Transcript_1686/g.2114 Transcript_1686/m.2114 type:complete len:103 (-) Transcript_1686:1828-2136(-)
MVVLLQSNEGVSSDYIMWISKNDLTIGKLYSKSLMVTIGNYLTTENNFVLFLSNFNLYSRVDFNVQDLKISKIIAYDSSATDKFSHISTSYFPIVKNNDSQA